MKYLEVRDFKESPNKQTKLLLPVSKVLFSFLVLLKYKY